MWQGNRRGIERATVPEAVRDGPRAQQSVIGAVDALGVPLPVFPG
jgi:hypothetical protein